MSNYYNSPLWASDGAAGGGEGFEVDFDDTTKSTELGLDQLAKLIQENPIARQVAAAALGGNQSEPQEQPQPTAPDPVSELETQLQEVKQQLEQNPQDANLFARKIQLEAQIGSLRQALKVMEPLAVQQNVQKAMTFEVPKVLSKVAEEYPDFDAIRPQVEAELQQQLMANPQIAFDPALLQHSAELIADHYFSRYIRSPKGGTGLPGQRASLSGVGQSPAPKVEGLSDEEAKLYEEAKAVWDDITPEEWKSYSQSSDDKGREFAMSIRNIVGRSDK